MMFVGHWCQNHFAEDEDGIPVNWRSEHACKFCIQGAIMRAYVDATDEVYIEVCTKAYDVYKESLTTWNDHPTRTHADVLALLKKAGV